MANAIEVRDVSKRFRLYQEQFTSLKERMLHGGKVPYEDFWALEHVGFEVPQGTTFGLLGHNGSGKSTLLKIIAGIIQPTSGEVVTRGRLAALLELGAGFQPELSGRENIYLNASLLGMSRKYVDAKFDEIVDFAELAPFIDNQVKYYSSGMYVRLGFAVAVNMDPDILIVDEVLAVGDELFQRKCLDRVKKFQNEGRTIVVVTHAADQVRQVCSGAAVLDHGHLVAKGTPGEAVRSFREHLLARRAYTEAEQLAPLVEDLTAEAPEAEVGTEPESLDTTVAPDEPPATVYHSRHSSDVKITYVRVEHPHMDERSYIEPLEPLTIRVGYRAERRVEDILPGVAVYDQRGEPMFGLNTGTLGQEVVAEAGDGEFVFEFPSVPLLDGTYPFTVGLLTRDEVTVYDWHEQQYDFAVMNPNPSYGMIWVPATITVAQTAPERVVATSVAGSETSGA
jgi:ABC-2 type transport system ATP-binding protein